MRLIADRQEEACAGRGQPRPVAFSLKADAPVGPDQRAKGAADAAQVRPAHRVAARLRTELLVLRVKPAVRADQFVGEGLLGARRRGPLSHFRLHSSPSIPLQ